MNNYLIIRPNINGLAIHLIYLSVQKNVELALSWFKYFSTVVMFWLFVIWFERVLLIIIHMLPPHSQMLYVLNIVYPMMKLFQHGAYTGSYIFTFSRHFFSHSQLFYRLICRFIFLLSIVKYLVSILRLDWLDEVIWELITVSVMFYNALMDIFNRCYTLEPFLDVWQVVL